MCFKMAVFVSRITAKHRFLLLCLVCLCLCSFTSATLSKSDKKKSKKSEDKVKVPPKPEETVIERVLVTEDVKWKSIPSEHMLYSEAHAGLKSFKGSVLGYVTPWNGHGYDIAKVFTPKFNYISPVWLQLIPSQEELVSINGAHDVDRGWLKDVRKGSQNVKVLPRLLFEGWTASTLLSIFRQEDRLHSVAETVVHFMQKYKFDGCVLEIWTQLGGHYKSEVTGLVEVFSSAFHSHGLQLILVIPSKLRGSLFNRADFDNLVDVVDGFSLMTYDYSRPDKPGPGPVAPLSWVRDCVESLVPERSPKRQKILLGLNFYGYDYATSVQPVLGTSFVDILKKHKPKIQWDPEGKEHFIFYKSGTTQHVVYYPSLLSVKMRIDLAQELGTGLSLWELGQGLDYFYDLF